MGIPLEAAIQAIGAAERGPFELWDCHEPAVLIASFAQWTVGVGFSALVHLGISSAEITATAAALGITLDAGLLADIREFEASALQVRNRK
jgi:hypothetical protein